MSQAGVDHQAVAVVHLHVPGIAEPGLFARPFPGQARFRIGGRLMSRIGASLTMKVDARVARIVGRGWLVIPFALETLVSGPGLDQRAVDRKMLVRKQSLGTRLLDYRVEKALCYLAHQQALSCTTVVLGEQALAHPRSPGTFGGLRDRQNHCFVGSASPASHSMLHFGSAF